MTKESTNPETYPSEIHGMELLQLRMPDPGHNVARISPRHLQHGDVMELLTDDGPAAAVVLSRTLRKSVPLAVLDVELELLLLDTGIVTRAFRYDHQLITVREDVAYIDKES